MTDRITKAVMFLEKRMEDNLIKANKCCPISQKNLGMTYVANAQCLKDVAKAFEILKKG